MGKGQGLTAGIEHPSVRILRPFLWLFPSEGYTLGRNPQGTATSWTFPSVPIVATVSSSAHKCSLLKSVPHQCPVSRWRTGQPTTSERRSLFLRTATLHYFRTTLHRLRAEVVQYNYPPFPPPRVLLFKPGKGGKEGGGGDTAVT